MGVEKGKKHAAGDKRRTPAKKNGAQYPGRGWVDNNLTPAQKDQCVADVNSRDWDTVEVLVAAWAAGYTITCKFDRGNPAVYMAVMSSGDPERVDFSCWASMRGNNPQDALDRVLWLWAVPFGREFNVLGERPDRDVW